MNELIEMVFSIATVIFVVVGFPISLLMIRLLADRVHKLEEGLKDAILYSMTQTAYIVKYSNAPADIIIADLRAMSGKLANVPDDLMGQILDIYRK